MYEKKIAELMKQLNEERGHSASAEEQLDAMKKVISDHQKSMQVNSLSKYGKDKFFFTSIIPIIN